MSRRSSRASMGGDNGEFYLECKAAYLSIYDSIKDEIESEEDLVQVLQQAGRNPSKKVLAKYWKADTENLAFDDFVEICKKEKATTADDLMKAFRKIDINGDGYISLEELYKIMTTKGEKMTRSEVKKMIDDVDENKDGRLDYGEFCKMIMETTEECKKMSRKIMEKKEQKRRREDQIKTSDSRAGSQVSLKSTTSLRSHNERPMSASSRSTKEKREESTAEPPELSTEEKNASEEKMGSKVSLRSKTEESPAEPESPPEENIATEDKMGSKVSLRSKGSDRASIKGSRVSLKSSKEEDQPKPPSMGSQGSVKATGEEAQQEESTGSQSTLKEAESVSSEQNMGSKVSIKSATKDETLGSRTTLRSKGDGITDEEIKKSSASMRSKTDKSEGMGSRASLKSKDGDTATQEKMGSKVSLKSQGEMGSKVSLKSRGESNMGSKLSLKSRGEVNSVAENVDDEENVEVRPSLAARKGSKTKRQINEGSMFGSFASIKSGASLAGSRKSLLSVDDLPKPSPRNKKSKGAAASTLSKLTEPKNLKEWTHTPSKGMFFLDEDTGNLLCHQYDLKLTEDTSVWITIQPLKSRCLADVDHVVDTGLFILRDKPDEDGNVLVSFTKHRDAKGKYGVKCSMDAGDYRIIPFTTGSRLKKREADPSSSAKLLQNKDGKYTISRAFRKALEDIFDLSDLDGNGTMSREEFNWYNIRTSDEEVGDDEWEVVEERLELENGEITKNGFLQLNELEAEDSNGDEDDMWVTLESLGFNKNLVMDEACPFLIDVYTEDCDDAEFKVAAIEEMMDKLQRPLCQSVMEKGEASKIKGMKDLTMYTYMSDTRATVVLDNKSYSTVQVNLDCTGSQNCLTNRPSLDETFTVKSQSQIIAYHFTPDNEDEEWNIKCTEIIQK
uniref:Sulfhydryl light chain n=1 Tax=Crassostrea virginica TaxID=6565 RepID=A0A8B8CMD4_CRAVI|nr:EF-hand calcium-binding domain-containing protein 7-like isoform X2 [Crassostrea virginica]